MDFEEKIETDLAYMQNKVAELDQIVAELQAQVIRLEKQNEFLNRKIEDLDTEARPNRKPPHYWKKRGKIFKSYLFAVIC